MGLEYFDNLQFFYLKLFQMHLETFLRTLRTCSSYLKGPPNLVAYVSEKIITARHTNQKIVTNNKIMT